MSQIFLIVQIIKLGSLNIMKLQRRNDSAFLKHKLYNLHYQYHIVKSFM